MPLPKLLRIARSSNRPWRGRGLGLEIAEVGKRALRHFHRQFAEMGSADTHVMRRSQHNVLAAAVAV